MQLVPIAPAQTKPQLNFQANNPLFAGPLMERIVYELHHSPYNSPANTGQNPPLLNGKVNQIATDLHNHVERHTLPYWPNTGVNPIRVVPFFPEEQNQYFPNPVPAKPIPLTTSYYPFDIWIPYYSTLTPQQKVASQSFNVGSKLQLIA